ncbi:MAG: NAD(P)H-hydrate dehydratase [Actinobacteria bacterium]|nr:NAD(P)H-hydrate dehydratase [Actinomycetota bacterium]
MIPIVTPAEMAAIDAAAPEPVEVLIGRAGWAVARTARRMLGGTYGRRVVVIAGGGNNGADGRVAGELLERRGMRVTTVEPSVRALPNCDLIIDAAFGTGLSRPWVAPRPANPMTPVLAVDIPSGVSGLTGEILGAPLRAAVTVTFAALKPGLLVGAGAQLAGTVECVDIGLDTTSASAAKVTAGDVAAWLPARAASTHKWRDAVRLVAGSPGMTGAADLASAAAFRAGSGYVRRSTPGVDPAVGSQVATGPVEAVTTPLASEDWAGEVLADIDRFGALAVGPGLGRAPGVASQVAALVATPVPIVIDGDGLHALGSDPASVLAERPAGAPPVVLTPHDGEFVALGGDAAGTDRFAAVRDLAARTGAIVLRKGATTLVAHPDGRVLASDTGDARLATAGTGDVLTGILGAFLARGVEPFAAAAAAAWVHGRAGARGRGVGLVASDLPRLVADVLADVASTSGVHAAGRASVSDDGRVRPRSMR